MGSAPVAMQMAAGFHLLWVQLAGYSWIAFSRLWTLINGDLRKPPLDLISPGSGG